MKPLKQKAYGSIAHLPGSRLGPADHHCHEGQAKIACEKARDKHDVIILQEKLDGSCCAVAKINGEIVPLTRAGYVANTSSFEQHQWFYKWVKINECRFEALLGEGERSVGEWLAMAHGTRYELKHEPFVIFDIMAGTDRQPVSVVETRCKDFWFTTPKKLHEGGPISIAAGLKLLGEYGHHGALDPAEGLVWRVERKGEVDYLVKYVRADKVDGKYFEETYGETVWNWKKGKELMGKLDGYKGDDD